jgi:hypothetical protein
MKVAVKASLTSPSTGAKKDNPVHNRKIVMKGNVDSKSDRRPKLSISQTAGMAKVKLTADGIENKVCFSWDSHVTTRSAENHLQIPNWQIAHCLEMLHR